MYQSKIIKNSLILLGFLTCANAFGQTKSDKYYKIDTTISFCLDSTAISQVKTLSDTQKLFELIDSLISANASLEKQFRNVIDDHVLANNAAIVLVRYPTSRQCGSCKNFHKTETVVLTKYSKNDWSSYIWDKKNILLIFIENAIYSEGLKITNKTSFFSTSLKGLLDIGLDIAKGKVKMDAENCIFSYPLRFVLLDAKKIRPPSEISVNIPTQEKSANKKTFDRQDINDDTPFDTTKIAIHERNHFAFSIGLNSSVLKKQNFGLSGDTVTVSLDSAQKKNLSNAISIQLEYYPFGGRDIDQYLPIWKDFKHFPHHIGFAAGLSLTKDPLQSYYGGLVLSITKAFAIQIGINLVNVVENDQSIKIDNINSIQDAEDFLFKRSYKSHFYFGISVSPAQAIKSFGL